MNYLFTFPDNLTEKQFLDLAAQRNVTAKWVSLNPNPLYNHEWQFTDEKIFPTVLNNDTSSPTWPDANPNEWTPEEKRTSSPQPSSTASSATWVSSNTTLSGPSDRANSQVPAHQQHLNL